MWSTYTPLGLDIGNFSVKFAQIKTSPFSKQRFVSFAITPVKDDSSRDKIIEAIKTSYKELAGDSKNVNISICGSNIITRYIILPRIGNRDLRKALEFELEKYIPYKKEDMVIDYNKLTNLPNNKTLVLFVATERRFIQERVNLVKDAGLQPKSINIDALALNETFKALPYKSKGAVAVLDIGYKLSKLIVLENDVPYLSRDIESGEYNIIQATAKRMGIDFQKAKEVAYKADENLGEIAKVITYDARSLLDELLMSFEYCERTLEKKVSQLYLTGGGSRNKILLESLKRTQNLKIDFLDITQSLKFYSSLNSEELKEKSYLLAVAIGLALQK